MIDWLCLSYQEGEQVYNNCDNRNDEHKGNPPHRTDSNGFWSLEEFLQNVLWKQEGVFQKKSFGRYGHERQFPAECSDGGGFKGCYPVEGVAKDRLRAVAWGRPPPLLIN